MLRLAIRAEFAGLLPTQKPGSVSKMPTLISPPYVACGAFVVVALTVVAAPHEMASDTVTSPVIRFRNRVVLSVDFTMVS
jgi:hypothetical protein